MDQTGWLRTEECEDYLPSYLAACIFYWFYITWQWRRVDDTAKTQNLRIHVAVLSFSLRQRPLHQFLSFVCLISFRLADTTYILNLLISTVQSVEVESFCNDSLINTPYPEGQTFYIGLWGLAQDNMLSVAIPWSKYYCIIRPRARYISRRILYGCILEVHACKLIFGFTLVKIYIYINVFLFTRYDESTKF